MTAMKKTIAVLVALLAISMASVTKRATITDSCSLDHNILQINKLT